MTATPVSAITNGLAPARLRIEVPSGQPDVPLKFNPTDYKIEKTNNLAEIPIPGLESPPIQFVRGGAAKLTVEVLLDTSDTVEDVRERYTNAIQNLVKVNPVLHAPPIVSFCWDRALFRGVLQKAVTTFQLFTPKGIPVRAKMELEILEYRPVEVTVREMRNESPNFEKSYTVRRGDTLTAISAWAYNDPTLWRVIADANGLDDPRRLVPGITLTLPRIR